MKISKRRSFMDKNIARNIESWIYEYVNSAHAKGVILGMSGGKDSFVTAALCVNALGKDKVLGIIMPNGSMKDCHIAEESCKELGINYYIINIQDIYNLFIGSVRKVTSDLNTVTTFNLPPRIRMTLLYAIAGSLGYLVANTSNLSEKEVGYTTKWGDNVGDFAPLANFTMSEVVELGLELGLNKNYVCKVPDDGLSGQSDEEKLGFSYDSLDKFIRQGIKDDSFDKIELMHKRNLHKREITSFKNNFENYFDKKEQK